MFDQLTTDIASEWIAKFDAAAAAEDLPEMERIVASVTGSPNRPFLHEVIRQLES